jgi:predicted phosphodiesterase
MFSDVHGNSAALRAVLTDIAATHVDTIWFGGDAAAIGYDPFNAVKLLHAIPNLVAVRGNTDRYISESVDTVHSHIERMVADAMTDRDNAIEAVMFRLGFAWAAGGVASAGLTLWLAGLPVEHRETLPDGTRVLLVHSSPGRDDGPGVLPDQSDAELGEVIGGADADLLIVGHTHEPVDRTLNGVRAWNLGSVSNPDTNDVRAMWTLLEANEDGYSLVRKFVRYDIPAMLDALSRVQHPSGAYIRHFWDGKLE